MSPAPTDLGLWSSRQGPRGSSPRVVLIHGAMDRGSSFQRVLQHLPKLDTTIYDRRGYAGSAALGAAQDLSRHVADVLALAADDRVVLVGHSFGGLVALGAAAQAPQQVEAVGVYEPPQPWRPYWPVRSDPTEPELAAVAFMERVIGPDRWARLPERVKDERRREGAALLSDLAMARTDLPFHLDDVLCAVSVCSGANTDHRFAQSAQDLASELTYADSHTIADAQHGAHLSQPEAFARWVQAVVDRARQ